MNTENTPMTPEELAKRGEENRANLQKIIEVQKLSTELAKLRAEEATYLYQQRMAWMKLAELNDPGVEHELTEEDLKNNPELKEAGLKAGDKVNMSVPQ